MQSDSFKRQLIYEGAIRISPSYIKYSFCLADNNTLSFKAGQYLDLVFYSNGFKEKRSYSIANPPNNTLIEFVIKDIEDGMASSRFDKLKKGDVILFDGPFGRLSITNWKKKFYILIATGSGIAPFRSMLSELEANMKSGENRVILLVGTGVNEKVPFFEEVLNSSLKYNNFKLCVCYGMKSNMARETWEFNEDIENKLVQILETSRPDKILIASSPNLINKIRLLLTSFGFSNEDVLSDI